MKGKIMSEDTKEEVIWPPLFDLRKIDSVESLIESDYGLLCYGYMQNAQLTKKESRLIQILKGADFDVEFVFTDKKETFFVIKKSDSFTGAERTAQQLSQDH